MAVSVSTNVNDNTKKFVVDATATSSVEADVLSGACSVEFIDIDNTGNSVAVYLKMYNAAAPTVGTDAPDMVVMAQANSRVKIDLSDGPIRFGTALSIAAVKEPGTAGTTDPDNAVPVTIKASV